MVRGIPADQRAHRFPGRPSISSNGSDRPLLSGRAGRFPTTNPINPSAAEIAISVAVKERERPPVTSSAVPLESLLSEMAAAPPIQVEGVHQAFDRVALLGAGARRSVVVQKMRVSEAGYALTIIDAAATEDPAWELTNRTAVERMAASAESLRLLLEVLLPKLRLRPTSPSRLHALRLHAAYLRAQAAEVSRSFLTEVVVATDRFSAYIEDAEALPPHNPHGHLLDQVDDFTAMVRRILDGTYTLRLPVGGAAAGGVEAALEVWRRRRPEASRFRTRLVHREFRNEES